MQMRMRVTVRGQADYHRESRMAGIMKLFVTLEMHYTLFKRKRKMPCPKKKA